MIGFGMGKGSLPGQGGQGRNLELTRRSNTSLFSNTLQPGEQEQIQEELDQNEYSMFQKNSHLGASIAPSRRMI